LIGWGSKFAAASDELAQGVEQVNTAVAEMIQVVQQNAANAISHPGTWLFKQQILKQILLCIKAK